MRCATCQSNGRGYAMRWAPRGLLGQCEVAVPGRNGIAGVKRAGVFHDFSGRARKREFGADDPAACTFGQSFEHTSSKEVSCAVIEGLDW